MHLRPVGSCAQTLPRERSACRGSSEFAGDFAVVGRSVPWARDFDGDARRSRSRAHLPGPHLRLPDERARLRAAGRPAGSGRATSRPPTAPTPTSWCSTPARCGRTPTTSSTATSATWCRASTADPDMQIAVGGCLAQKDRDAVLRRAPWVDVVFGTHNIGSLPTLLERARHNKTAQVEIVEALQEFPSTLPAARESAYAAWVSISVGCNNTLHVLHRARRCAARRSTAGPATSSPRSQSLVDQGVLEVTLLGQNVNAYGVSFADPRPAARPRRLRAAAARLRAHRRPGAGAVHLAAPGRVHRRRHRGDGRDAERLPDAAHAAAVRLGPHPAGHAPVLPRRALPRHHRPRAGGDPARRDHHRPDRRVPRRDRGGLRCHPRRGRAGPVRQRVHLPVLEAAGHPGRRAARPAAESRCAGTLSAAHRAPGADLARGEPRPDRHHRRGAGRRGRGPQGRQHRPDVAAGPATAGWCTSPRRTRDDPPGRRRHHHRHRRRAAPPDRRRPRCSTHRRTRAGDAHEAGRRAALGVGLGLPGIGMPARRPSTGCAR